MREQLSRHRATEQIPNIRVNSTFERLNALNAFPPRRPQHPMLGLMQQLAAW
jgi:hypothetical protein